MTFTDTLSDFLDNFLYYLVIFLYVAICGIATTYDYKGEKGKAIVTAIFLPFLIFIFSPILTELLGQHEQILPIATATVMTNLFFLYVRHKEYKK